MNWRALFGCKEVTTEVRLDDLELGEGDKLLLLYPGALSNAQVERLKSIMEESLKADGKKVVVLEGNPRVQVVRKFSEMARLFT